MITYRRLPSQCASRGKDPPLAQDGGARWESSGQLSLDPAAVREKLGRYYVLKLVQAAVSNGVSYFHVASRSGGFDFDFDGPGWSRQELNGLLAGSSDSHVRHLASGWCAGSQARPLGGALRFHPSRPGWDLCR